MPAAASPNNNDSSSSVTSPSSAKPNRKRGVPHVYRDYSNTPDTIGYVRKKTGGVTQPFPEKLHELLEQENEPTIVSWLPHGRAFLVRKPKEFTQDVMPRYDSLRIHAFPLSLVTFLLTQTSLFPLQVLPTNQANLLPATTKSLWFPSHYTRCRCWCLLPRVVPAGTPPALHAHATAKGQGDWP